MNLLLSPNSVTSCWSFEITLVGLFMPQKYINARDFFLFLESQLLIIYQYNTENINEKINNLKKIHYVEAIHPLDVHSYEGSLKTSHYHILYGKIPGGWLLLVLVWQLHDTTAGVSVMALTFSF